MRYFFIITVLLTFFSNPAHSALVTFKYDPAGNMVSEQGKYYEYNDANQLVRVRKDSPTGEIIAEYVYDYQGQRVKKIENGVTTYYIGKHYEERKGKTVDEKTSYFFANSQRIAKSSQKNKAPPEVSYYLNNHLGSADVIIDENGKVLDNIKYLPFGGYRTFPKERHTYTGKERDEVTDNYYFEARYYNPNIRRFTQADTIVPDLYDPQSLNRYAYARNSPVVYTDPSGHSFEDFFDVLSLGYSVYSFASDPSLDNADSLISSAVALNDRIDDRMDSIKYESEKLETIEPSRLPPKFRTESLRTRNIKLLDFAPEELGGGGENVRGTMNNDPKYSDYDLTDDEKTDRGNYNFGYVMSKKGWPYILTIKIGDIDQYAMRKQPCYVCWPKDRLRDSANIRKGYYDYKNDQQ